jgi:hypothetical protein
MATAQQTSSVPDQAPDRVAVDRAELVADIDRLTARVDDLIAARLRVIS